ncbi:hypothetical protein O181_088552 [Austropuccinia psidii MF-1]|uniref:Uncharacterized protein n=1 Tax=Austropuccinia psidii MF-1 TaxID=1389203 RepID=A0A9Q3IRU9_9BASI|nr:hypothetical protein [Austropuccinia psidii MF-1]
MISCYCCYGSGFKDFINPFPAKEVERMIFGDPSPTSHNTSLLDWALASTRDPSPPLSLASFLQDSSPSYLEENPDSAMVFYAFIEGDYNPCLFVKDPLNFFARKKNSSSIKPRRHFPKRKSHSYCQRPPDSNGRAITTCHLH